MWKMFRQFNLLGKVTNVANDNNSLQSFSLLQNYPNPFNPSTLIRYALPSSAHVKLTIHDILGREIATLVNEEQSAGWKEIQWNAQNFASGMYLVRMSANNFTQAKKILLMK
jgi:flagellar hook assembly protein FlgD